MSNLPSICKDHPKAQIRHEWNSAHITCGTLVGAPVNHGHQYFCADCGKELCSPEEYEQRMNEQKS